MNKFFPVLLILVLVFFITSSCSRLELESTWKDRDIVLDGKGGDWLGAKYYFEDLSISVGLINDTQHLYVSMMTENPMARAQMMRQGLTVWLDPEGGKKKIFGIKFPLGRQRGEREEEGMTPWDMMDEETREDRRKRLQESRTEVEV